MRHSISIERAARDRKLLGAALGELSTWSTWLAVLKAAFGLPLDGGEATEFASVSGGRALPGRRVRELWCICGRRSGKSRMAAIVGAYLGACVDHSRKLVPGEIGMVLILAPTVAQAGVVFGYLRAFLEGSPVLRELIEAVTADEVRLKGGIVIGVHPASYRTVRGPTLLAVVFDESAYWRDETAANPDIEVYRAVLPALATTEGMLVAIGTPYRKLGLLFTKYRDGYGTDDADVLVVQGPTTAFNPTIDTTIIETAERNDPASAMSEWQALFRTDLSSFLDDASIDVAIAHGRPLELPPRGGLKYHAYTDPSGGRHDAYTICIGHREGDKIVADVVRGRKPPLDPVAVTSEYVALARSYFCTTIHSDSYAAEWHVSAVRAAGAVHERSELPASGLYLEGLPFFARGLIEIPNSPQLVRELRLLERRVARSGKDTVSHGASGTDDYANSLFGMMYLAGGLQAVDWGPIAAAVHQLGPYRRNAGSSAFLGERALAQARRRRGF